MTHANIIKLMGVLGLLVIIFGMPPGFGTAASDSRAAADVHAADSVLMFSTYLGTGDFDRIADVASDENGNIYVVGRTSSPDFPLTADAFDSEFGGLSEGFVTIFDQQGNLTFSSFLGGSDWDNIDAVEVRADRYLYMFGETLSSDFLTTEGAVDRTYNGITDMFVVQYDLDSGTFVYSTFLGGSDNDFADDLAVDENGNVVVSGTTSSLDYPTTTGAYDRVYAAGDAFISKISTDGSALQFSTFLGGSGSEFMTRVALDGSGSVFLIGRTNSIDFPTTANAFDDTLDGQHDAFIVELSSAGTELLYGTYLGGTGWDEGHDIKVTQDAVIVAGFTLSSDFPVTAGSYDTTYGYKDAYVASFRRDHSGLNFATFVGGSGEEGLKTILIDGDGQILLTGFTTSTDFPVSADAYDSDFNGGSTDIYVARLSAQGDALTYATYFGGDSMEFSQGMVLGQPGHVVVAGDTESSNFPVTQGAFDATYNGGRDAYLTTIQIEEIIGVEAVNIPGASTIGEVGASLSFTATITPTTSTLPITFEWQASGQTPITHVVNNTTDTVTYTWPLTGTKQITLTATNAGGSATATHTLTIAEMEEVAIVPDEPATLTYTTAAGLTTTVQIPAGAVTEPTTLIYEPRGEAEASGLLFAGRAFELNAFREGVQLPDFTFELPLAITIQYSDDDVEGVEESELRLFVWEEDAWMDAATTCSPPSDYSRNLEGNTLGVSICHLSYFALFGPESDAKIFLPFVVR